MLDDPIDGVMILAPTNTQTRRLGYLTQICKMLRDEAYPVLNLVKDLESWAFANQESLTNHISDKGVIRPSSTSLAAKRYVKLAQDLELVIEGSGYLRPTKTGRVLLALNEECTDNSSSDNLFRLTSKERLLLTYEMLLLDSDYLLPILELTTRCHKQLEIQEQTQNALLKHLEILESHAPSQSVRSDASNRVSTLMAWKKPKKYSEHLVLPRLHWLLDLELLNWDTFRSKKEFTPSTSGNLLLKALPLIDGHRFTNRRWCQNNLFSVWADLLRVDFLQWSNVPVAKQDRLIKEHVKKGFSYFRTMEYRRVSAYQLVLFTVIRLLLCEKIAAGFEDIKQALSAHTDSSSREWVFYWTAMDDDGYLLLS